MMRLMWEDWERFWFAPRPRSLVVPVRIALCLTAAVWFASFLSSAAAWFAPSGLLNHSLSAQLLQFDQSPGWQNWSPLWFSDSSGLHQAWLLAGILLALVAAGGWGGRLTLALLLIWVISWAHRISWLQSGVEPVLVSSLAYLLVEPGPPLRWGKSSEPGALCPTWQSGLALRLLQTHWWLLVAAGLLSQLAGLIWWRGEGVWWLAAAGRSLLLTTAWFREQPILTNAFGHAVIAVQMLALWLLLIPSARLLGIALGVLVGCIYGLVADQLLYALWLWAGLASFAVALPKGR